MQSASEPTSRIEMPLHCAACGYNLAGLPAAGQCPECAQPLHASLPPRLADLPNLACMKCHHAVGALAEVDRCPQCGVLVRESLAWIETLRQVARTPRHPELSWVLIALAFGLYFLSLFVLPLQGFNLLLAIAVVIMITGIFRATMLPDRPFPATFTTPYSVARGFALGIAGCCMWYWASQWMLSTPGATNFSLWSNLAGFAIVLLVVCHIIALTSAIRLRARCAGAMRTSLSSRTAGPSESH